MLRDELLLVAMLEWMGMSRSKCWFVARASRPCCSKKPTGETPVPRNASLQTTLAYAPVDDLVAVLAPFVDPLIKQEKERSA